MLGCTTQDEKAAIIKELREERYQLKYLLKGSNMCHGKLWYQLEPCGVRLFAV